MLQRCQHSEAGLSVRTLTLGITVLLVLQIGMWYLLALVGAASRSAYVPYTGADSAVQLCASRGLAFVGVDWVPGRPQAICQTPTSRGEVAARP